MSISNADIRRQLRSFPTGENDLSQYEFRVTQKVMLDDGIEGIVTVEGGLYWISCDAWPGLQACGETPEEARENANQAIRWMKFVA